MKTKEALITVSFRLPVSKYVKLKEIAESDSRTASFIIQRLIDFQISCFESGVDNQEMKQKLDSLSQYYKKVRSVNVHNIKD